MRVATVPGMTSPFERHPYLPLILVSAWCFLCLAVGMGTPLLIAYLGQQ